MLTTALQAFYVFISIKIIVTINKYYKLIVGMYKRKTNIRIIILLTTFVVYITKLVGNFLQH